MVKHGWLAMALIALLTFGVSTSRATEVAEGTKAGAGGRTGQQTIVVGPDSIRKIARGTNGIQDVNVTGADKDQIWYYTDIINNTAISANSNNSNASDSSAMLNTTGWKHMALWVYPTCNGGGTSGNCDSVFYATYAIQVRGGPTAVNDSIGAHPWTRVRQGSANAADTVGGTWTTFGYDSLQTRADPTTELILVANLSREKAVMPYGYRVDLVDPRTGVWFSSNYTSIRIRPIDVFNASQIVFREASPDNRTRVRVDLFGWR